MSARTIAIVAVIVALAPGCKKKAVQTIRAPAASSPAAPVTKPAPEPESPPAADLAPEKAPVPAVAPEKPEEPAVRDRVTPPEPAAPSSEPLPMAFRAAVDHCESKPDCAEIDALSVMLHSDVEGIETLLKKGTDQEKRLLREALLRATHPDIDPLLVSLLVSRRGSLDTEVLERVIEHRISGAVQPLAAHLATLVGPESVTVIDALSAIGGAEARKACAAALTLDRIRPFRGAVCRALSRLFATDQEAAVTKIGARLSATPRQLVGCRGAEAAFKMIVSVATPAYNVDGARKKPAAFLVVQPDGDPRGLELLVSTTPGATCEAPGETALRLRVPLDRDYAPIVGAGLVAEVTYAGQPLGTDGAFLFRFDALELRAGSPAKGLVYVTHTTRGEPRVLLSGRWEGTYCGVGDSRIKRAK